jgi:outer membrane protein
MVMVAPSGFAQQSAKRTITLAEAVRLANTRNPSVQIASLNSALAIEDQRRALSGLLPQISVGMGEAVQRNNVETSLGTTAGILPQHEGPFPVFTTGTRFSVPLFNASLLEHYRAQKANRAAAEVDISSAREEIVTLTVTQYLLSLRTSAVVKACESQVVLAQRLFEQAQNQENAGAGTGLDTLRAKQKLKTQQQALIVAHEQEQTSRFVLVRLLNLPPATDLILEDLPSFDAHAAVDSPEAAIQSAWRSRPEMVALKNRLLAAQRELASSRARRLPSLSLDGAWYQQGSRPDTVIPVYQYQASLSIPVFTGGRIRSDIASSTLRIDRLRRDEQELKNQIALEVKTAMAKLASALQEVAVADSGLALAQEEVRQAQDRFQSGVGDNVEVVTAQDTLARAYADQIAARYRVNQSHADLVRAMGYIRSAYEK